MQTMFLSILRRYAEISKKMFRGGIEPEPSYGTTFENPAEPPDRLLVLKGGGSIGTPSQIPPGGSGWVGDRYGRSLDEYAGPDVGAREMGGI